LENAANLGAYVRYQGEHATAKISEDLKHPDEWTFADLAAISQIIEQSHQSIEEIMHSIPSSEWSIRELEKPLKKSNADSKLNLMVSGAKEIGDR
jgi:hypothetical protein